MTEEGRMVPEEGTGDYLPQYFLRDHLGNIRVCFTDTDSDGDADVIQENHFYPYGMTMGDLNYVADVENKYLYQGKENIDELSLYWYEFGARMFDEQLGRWHVVDPLSQSCNPYAAMSNNPVSYIDPDGRWAVGGPNLWYRHIEQMQLQMDRANSFWIEIVAMASVGTANTFIAGGSYGLGGGQYLVAQTGSGGSDGLINSYYCDAFGNSVDQYMETSLEMQADGYTHNSSGEWVRYVEAFIPVLEYSYTYIGLIIHAIGIQQVVYFDVAEIPGGAQPNGYFYYFEGSSWDNMTLSLYGDRGDGSYWQMGSWDANSGPYGNGALPNGTYEVQYEPWMDREENYGDPESMTRDDVRFKLYLRPNFETPLGRNGRPRGAFFIHPDGGINEGTLGCPGLTGSGEQLQQFYNTSIGILNGSSLPIWFYSLHGIIN